MKRFCKPAALLLTVLLLTALLAGCGSSSYSTSSADSGTYNYSRAVEDADIYDESAAEEAVAGTSGGSSSDALITGTSSADLSQKLIYTASANIETLHFDESVAAVTAMLDQYGAFLESSYTSGSSYEDQFYGYAGGRSASFVIRVPKENYAALTGALDTLGNVTSLNSSVENITEQYTDTDSRLQTYRTEEERLLAMLEKAETVEDMISIEERLSDVRYNIESLTARLRNWDNEINYSTVNIYLQEVEELTEYVPVQRTYGEKLRDGLVDTLNDIGRFFSNLFLWLVSALPVLILLAVIAVVIVIIIRVCLKHRKTSVSKKRRTEKAAKKAADIRFNPDDGTPIDSDNSTD